MRSLQPLAGSFATDGNGLRFIPRFPFQDGTSYSLLIGVGPAASGAEVWSVTRPATPVAPTTDVVAIYPSSEELPVNQLKLYVHFSSSMSEGWAARAVHVRRADTGEPLRDVFIAHGPELWDPQRRRLTLLLDPGRIKRGLAPHEEAGYPLVEGVPIVVKVDEAFRGARGQPLRASMERCYKVGPVVRARIDPSDWRYHFPPTGSNRPLIVEFDRPLDHALLEHSLWVTNTAGAPLEGRVSVGVEERSWRFEPDSPWGAGRYTLTVDPSLEDLAGNSVRRVFDRDLHREEDTPIEVQQLRLDFYCAGG